MPEFPDHGKICSSLQSEDKFARKKALQEILKNVESPESLDEKAVSELWEVYHRPVVRTLHDEAEACRDLALDILKKFILQLPCSDKNIVYVIPILAKRLGPQELIEPSEEVRLKCVALLKAVLDKYQDGLAAYFEDLLTILSRTVTDNYPKVKQESCDCICALAQALPEDFHKRSAAFVKPILGNIAHPHHRVRASAVMTIGQLLIHGDSKLMENVAGPLAERLFDQSGAVRTAVVEVAGKWMLELRDRYSWWHKLLPLLLTGINDVVPEIRARATKLWLAVGEQYIVENDTDKKFKEKLDFLPEYLPHYPPNVARPNLGCRTIAQQNLCKLTAAISRELNDWLADIRLRAAQLLCILALNVEEEVTNYIGKLLPAMYRACNDEDKRVAENVELAAEYMAYFVPTKIFLDAVMPSLEASPSCGHLKVLAGVVRGSPQAELAGELPRLGAFLRDSPLRQSRKARQQLELLGCCRALLRSEDSTGIAASLFETIFGVLALAAQPAVEAEARELLERLASAEQLEDVDRLLEKRLRDVLGSVQSEPETWSLDSWEYRVFLACLGHARSASYRSLDLVRPVFQRTAEAEPKLRLKQYIILAEYVQRWDGQLDEELAEFVGALLESVVVPGLHWAAGRTAEATRTACVCCLCALLGKLAQSAEEQGSRFRVSIERFGWLFEQVRPALLSLIEDEAHKTRLHALRAICLVMNIGQELGYVTEEHVHKTSPEVLTRLEDQHDEVRLAAIEAVKEVWKVLPRDYDLSFYYVHIDYAYGKMLTHLDDPGEKFQKQTFDCLMDLMKVHPELLIEKIQESRVNFINQKALDQIIEAAQDYLINKKS